MATLTPQQLRNINVFVETGIMNARRKVIPQWQHLATKATQSNITGLYAWLADLPTIGRKLTSGYNRTGVSAFAFTLESEEFGQIIEIKARDVRNDNSGVFKDLPGAFGTKIEEFPQANLFRLLKEGDQTTLDGKSILAFDGLSYFNDAHYVNGRNTADGTYDNKLATGALTTTTFGDAYAALSTMPNNKGDSLNLVPNKLIVPPQLRATAASILMADTITVGAYNPNSMQSLKAQGLPPVELVVAPELSGDSAIWYLAAVEGGMSPLIYQETVAPSILALTDPRDYNMVHDDLLMWICKLEAAFGFADPRRIVRCNG